MKLEVAESANQSSRDVAVVQKYLLRTAAHSRPAVSLAAISSTAPLATSARVTRKPENLQRVRFTTSDQNGQGEERVVVEQEEEDEQALLGDRSDSVSHTPDKYVVLGSRILMVLYLLEHNLGFY